MQIMKKKVLPSVQGSTLFLKIVILLMGVAVLAFLLWMPPNEGVAKGKNLVSIYLDPVIIYIYIGSIPFFTALYQAFKLLNLIDNNKVFTERSVKALKNIKYCAIAIIGFILVGLLYIRFGVPTDPNEDKAGPMALGIAITFISTAVATFAGILQKLFQNAVDLKSENDLTV
jgi:hypothetical protein